MTFDIITTERLLLRKITPIVLRQLFEDYSDKEIKHILGIETDEALGNERAKYKLGLSTFNRSFLYFHLLDPVSEINIGWCGYHTWYLQHHRAEIGYVLAKENYRQKGLMTEAMTAIIHYGFNAMNLHRIEAFVGSDNVASLSIMERFHFKKEGLLREHYVVNNRMEDSLVFSLLKHEYAAYAT
jgi:[ribosomal protein S5]-alanine N-acetyltransferase